MDSELQVISALLRANDGEKEEFYLKQVPKGIFVIRGKEIDWIYRFREKHGVYPSVRAFKSYFQEPLPKVDDPLISLIEPVLDMAMFEQMRRVQEKVKTGLDKGESISKMMGLFKAEASKLTSYSTSYVDVSPQNSLGALLRYRERIKTHTSAARLDTPWHTLNRLIKFFSYQEVVALSGRNSLGKSWLVSIWADHYAKQGLKTLVITKEMPTRQFEDRNEAIRFKLPYVDFRDTCLPPRILRRWKEEKAESLKLPFEKYPLIISGEETIEGVGLAHVISKIQQYGASVVFVDGAYLIYPEELPANVDSTKRFMYLSNRFKAIAKALNILIFVVLQDNRTTEDSKGNARSTNTGIYGADTWAQDADWVFGMAGRRGGDHRTIILNKGRESMVGEFNVKFSLDPCPDFSDMGVPPAQQAAPKQTVKFQGGIK